MANKQKKKQAKKAAQQAQQSAQNVVEIQLGSPSSQSSAPSPQPPQGLRNRQSPQQAQKIIAPPKVYNHEIILNALSDAGYHRARVTSLSLYDRILGGICWAMSMSYPKPKGKQWWFFEEVDGAKKNDKERQAEITQMMQVKSDIHCNLNASNHDILNMNPQVVGPLVDFVLARINNMVLDKNAFFTWSGLFVCRYDNRPTFLEEHFYALRIFNTNQYSDAIRMLKFDHSIIRDDWVTGRQMLYEYANYSRTGRRTFPSTVADGYEIVRRPNPELVSAAVRDKLDILMDTIMNSLTERTHENVLAMIDLVDELRFAVRLSQIEIRFYQECGAFHKMYSQFHDEGSAFLKTNAVAYEINPSDPIKVTECVEDIKERFQILNKYLLGNEIVEKEKRSRNLRQNYDEYDPLGYYHADNSHRADVLDKEVKKLRLRAMLCNEIPKELDPVFEAYNNLQKKKEDSFPEPTEEHIGLFQDIDYALVDDITFLMTSVTNMLDELDQLPPIVDKIDYDFRQATRAYANDCHNILSDWYWKARILKEERRNLHRKMRDLRMDAKIVKHKIFFAKPESTLLMKLNGVLGSVTYTLKRWETESMEFKIDWASKIAAKEDREAKEAKIKEEKRLQALEDARAAKQAKIVKSNKKGSGKKGRFGKRH
ncbi:Protein CBG07324 [Caenorhabditis briggsae]|uniref:Coiled-coil domain-containing protein 93 n=2 Tax=Caenorhabditis briggsae TaxID=6238 RepID=A8X505_CAEBR|nr:Protein CBG07324 [Caenorhabditis briggsae]ULT84964.1 hypothetical protein L3Y34_013564 [Caenorhabditis briggsae]CAP27715.1 Protein CBG07324 [Caenorhabditis briggsae]